MRITGGALKGRAVPGAVGPGVRPTSAKVREALFSSLGQDLRGLTALDACAGSGALSFEALSRGLDRAVLVERHPGVARGLKAAAKALGVEARVRLIVGASPGAWPPGEGFDLVFLDPPYADDPGPLLAAAARVARRRVVLETDARREVPTPEGLTLLRERRYGDSALRVYGPAAEF